MPLAELGAFSRRQAKLLAWRIPGFTVLLCAWYRPARAVHRVRITVKQKAHSTEWALWLYEVPGGVLLSHGECHTTIVAAAFHF